MLRIRLQPPCAYQGGKRRQAPEIVRHMGAHAARDVPFIELCAGGAAVSLELISRGKPPELVTLVDAGPWGRLWRDVGEGCFPLSFLEELLRHLPSKEQVPEYLSEVRATTSPTDRHASAVFVLLQSGSFGGSPVGVDLSGSWKVSGFRKHDPLSPFGIGPAPNVILRRMEDICTSAQGVTGIQADEAAVKIPESTTAYIDPPYAGTAGYQHDVSPLALAVRIGSPLFVSERIPLNDRARLIRKRAESGMNGLAIEVGSAEYLSLFNAEWTTPELAVERVEQGSLFG